MSNPCWVLDNHFYMGPVFDVSGLCCGAGGRWDMFFGDGDTEQQATKILQRNPTKSTTWIRLDALLESTRYTTKINHQDVEPLNPNSKSLYPISNRWVFKL